MYHRAANMFKMAKNWMKAGDAFCEVANLSLKNQNRHDAATNFVDAANCYKKVTPTGMPLGCRIYSLLLAEGSEIH